MKSFSRLCITLLVLFLSSGFGGQLLAAAPEGEDSEGFQASELLMHHLLETHDWHILDVPVSGEDGETHYIPVSIQLPYLVFDSRTGLEFFFLHGHHGHLDSASQAFLDEKGYTINSYGVITGSRGGATVIDFSLSKTPLQMLLVGLLLIWVFTAVARSYKRRPNEAPRGLQSLLEPVIVFLRDNVFEPNLGEHSRRFEPYLYTLFFFIWFANLLGLTPLNSNITGNISITLALAVLTLILTNVNGTKDYWQHIFAMPGVPKPILAILIPVELIGIFTKPFALTVRLFANIAAGHFMVLSLVSLIFIMSNGGQNVVAAAGIAPMSIAFSVAIFFLELIVAAVQAYVFAMLTAVFIGGALERHDDH